MRVAVLGGTGFVGKALVPALVEAGHEVVLLCRPKPGGAPPPSGPSLTPVEFDGRPDGEWTRSLEGVNGVVNLAGATIGARWTAKRKELIRSTRVDLTKMLVQALGPLQTKPRVLVNASGIGYYGDRGDAMLTESDAAGDDFAGRLAADWEAAALGARAHGIRVVAVRTAVTFGPGGGSLPVMTLPFKLFVGGPLGSGRQWLPWIHLDDLVRIYIAALEDDRLSGPVNAAAGSVRERDLGHAIGRALHRPYWLPAPFFAVRLVFLGFADALKASQRVTPAKLEAMGFEFRWPQMEPALRDALGVDGT
jgi:hypothetical protein